MDVLQVVKYVKQDAKMVYLLECLQKTAPPVIIFSENKNEVDGTNLLSEIGGYAKAPDSITQRR
jgi:superfamily II DNA/RNA helicase